MKQSLLRIFAAESERTGPENRAYRVHIGALLSGSAQIYSGVFRDTLVDSIPPGEDSIVGGEMEGVGLLSISPQDAPDWIVVKGISDFADEDRRHIDRNSAANTTRADACRNAASFVLSALVNDQHT